MRNNEERERRKKNIFNQRQRVFIENIMARDQQKQELAQMSNAASQEALHQMNKRDEQAAKIYEGKLNAHKRKVEDFTKKLIHIRNSCEQQSLTSL